METGILDLVIVGSGPAGLSAAIYAARAELNFIVVEKEPMSGGQIINTYEVDNYPGIPGVNGFDLAQKFREHSDRLNAEHKNGRIVKITNEQDYKCLYFADDTTVKAKCVIIATGAVYRKLGVPGEVELAGMGVSYCATCDGAFFRNKTVAVVGGGDVAVEDAIFLARFCKQVYVVHRRDSFRAAKSLTNRLLALENVTVMWDSVVNEIKGKDMVSGITIQNKKTSEIKELSLEGVFIAVGTIPNSAVFQGIADMNEAGYLIADETGKTSTPGIFAAGDVRTKQLRQVVTAAADGANAITSVERYLNEL